MFLNSHLVQSIQSKLQNQIGSAFSLGWLVFFILSPMLAQAAPIDGSAFYAKVIQEKQGTSCLRYRQIRETPALRSELADLIAKIEKISADEFSRMTREEKIAILINSYNLQLIHLVVSQPSLNALNDLSHWYGKWMGAKKFKLLGQQQSFTDLLKDQLLYTYNDSRIFFLVESGMRSGPNMGSQWVQGSNLESLLESRSKVFASDTALNRFDAKAQKLFVSSFFKKNGKFFDGEKYFSVRDFLAPRMGVDLETQKTIRERKTVLVVDIENPKLNQCD